MIPLMVAVLAAQAPIALAQGAFPAPLPGQAGASANNPAFPFPPANDSKPTSAACMKAFIPLREDAEKKGKLIRAATDRHASPEEACKIIGTYNVAEVKMLKYVETNAAECGIPGSVMEQLKAGHKKTEALESKVCAVVEQIAKRGGSGQINDFGDPAFQPRRPVGDFPDTNGRN
jgi:hypothetical protein